MAGIKLEYREYEAEMPLTGALGMKTNEICLAIFFSYLEN